jgi:hypothetical protein
MARKVVLLLSVAVCLVLALPGASLAAEHRAKPHFKPGAAGAGDPYFPLDGNGGYNVKHYDLDIRYDPATGKLRGVATITARATQDLSRFDLDFTALTVRSITVGERGAKWKRTGQELVVTPKHGLENGTEFTIVVRYDGIPVVIDDPVIGVGGFFRTDDGAIIVGEPQVASTWFPVNDHPTDKASYTFHVTVPKGTTAVANGVLRSHATKHGWTTWVWDAREPMASYLATASIGTFDLHAYQQHGIRYWDAIDPDLLAPVAAPRTGSQFALSQTGDSTYKRLAHTIAVPAGGADLSLWVDRDTEFPWDFVFIEAHTVGAADWTTLPDLNGHTGQDTGFSCPGWQAIHPFLARYQTNNGDGTCAPSGTSGAWWAATGASDGWEQWAVDLSAWAGKQVEVSISYASDDAVQQHGVFVDDVVSSTGQGTTSFEADADPLDGWTIPGAPAGSPANVTDWIVGSTADLPPPAGAIAQGSFARQPEILAFLAQNFGKYPFSASGGVVDDIAGVGFALENQTRPVYPGEFFTDPRAGASVVVHELTHQWYGDSLAVGRWQDIWLNEGFATYAEWLWSDHEGLGTAQDNFDFWYGIFDADHPFWTVTIGDPTPAFLFNFAIYARGAMTLHQLRLTVGDAAFFKILQQWARTKAGGNVTTPQFIKLAEKISGQDLDPLFQTWLFSPTKPVVAAPLLRRAAHALELRHAPPAARSLWLRYGNGQLAP